MQGLIGKKIGMTRFFNEETGQAIPVTVIEAGPNVVHQVKTVDRDGYAAVQLGFESLPERKVDRPMAGHCARHNSTPTRVVREFKCDSGDEEITAGQTLGVEVFEQVRYIDIAGTSKGRGTAGTIKRWNFQRGRETHGNKNHRERGSLGAGTYPARVFPGVHMAGRMGNVRKMVKNLEVVGLDKEAGLVYVKGAVPGPKRGIVYLKKSSKN